MPRPVGDGKGVFLASRQTIFLLFHQGRVHQRVDFLLSLGSLVVNGVNFARKLDEMSIKALAGFARSDRVLQLPECFIGCPQARAFFTRTPGNGPLLARTALRCSISRRTFATAAGDVMRSALISRIEILSSNSPHDTSTRGGDLGAWVVEGAFSSIIPLRRRPCARTRDPNRL